jgi:hypothetical protein
MMAFYIHGFPSQITAKAMVLHLYVNRVLPFDY